MKKAFTLAEVLITLGVIGVVAALTIPSLSNNYQKRVLTTQLQKAYSEISQAGAMAMADEMTDDFRTSKTVRNKELIGKYLKASSIGVGKFPRYKKDGNDNYSIDQYLGYNTDNYSCGKMSSGAYICVTEQGVGVLDINGEKGPNIMGKDAFTIGFGRDGSLSEDYDAHLKNIIENDWDMDKS